jgi:transposase
MYFPQYVMQLRNDVRLLRLDKDRYLRAHAAQKQKAEDFKEQLKEKDKRIRELEKENERLKKEIEKLLTTNERYQIALFDHGNFKRPEDTEKKPRGGQRGHADTNREPVTDYTRFPKKRLFAKVCFGCGSILSRTDSIRTKILLDIVINPTLVQFILESERQWCGNCKKEVNAKDPQSLPFTEFGMNTFMMVLLLRFRCLLSFGRISQVLFVGYGLSISEGALVSMLKQAKLYLGGKYDELVEAVRQGEIMYVDETGWLVRGNSAWMWMMANEGITVYKAAESRGGGIAKELYGNSHAKAMTDGLSSYRGAIPKEDHLYCWSHVLRFAHEETVKSTDGSMSLWIRDELVRIYHIKKEHPEYSKKQLEAVLRAEFTALLKASSDEEAFNAIQYRIREQQEGLIQALLVTADGTNNLAERRIRDVAIARNISFGSDTYAGMETTAVLMSVVKTLSNKQETDFFEELNQAITSGIKAHYPQYNHIAYADT